MESGLDQSALMRVCDVTHSTSLLKGIQHDGLMDVMFICRGNVKVYSQKLVLISVSPFMKVLLSHVSCCPHTMFCLSLPDINPVALEQVLNFLYEGIMKVCGSELQDFSDAMYVLGIEVPETATATLLDSFDVPKSRTCTQPPQVASQHSVGEPVDPLNVPDYYHDPTSVACVGLPPTLVAPDASSASPMNATPLNRAVESMKPAAGGRVLGSGLAKTTMSRTNSNAVLLQETSNSKKKIATSVLSEEHTKFLEHEFLKNPAPSAKYKRNLAKRLKVNEKAIKNWFTNTRKKIRAKKQYMLPTAARAEAVSMVRVKEEVGSFGCVG